MIALRRCAFTITAIALFVLAAPAAPAVAALSPAQREALLTEAQSAYDRGVGLSRHDQGEAAEAFREAAARFTQLADDGVVNGYLEYDLANAHLQAGEIGRAILHYRRADQLIRGDPRLEHNLNHARSLRRNQFNETGGRALAAALLGWHERTSLGARLNAFLAAWAVFWAVIGWHLVAPRAGLRWAAAALAVVSLGLGASVAVDLFSGDGPAEAVVLSDGVIVRKGNGEGFDPMFLEPLHQGVEVRVAEERSGWCRVELPDGKGGWVPADRLEKV